MDFPFTFHRKLAIGRGGGIGQMQTGGDHQKAEKYMESHWGLVKEGKAVICDLNE